MNREHRRFIEPAISEVWVTWQNENNIVQQSRDALYYVKEMMKKTLTGIRLERKIVLIASEYKQDAKCRCLLLK